MGTPPQPPAASLAHVYLEQLPMKLDPAKTTYVSYDDGNGLVLMATANTLRAWPVRPQVCCVACCAPSSIELCDSKAPATASGLGLRRQPPSASMMALLRARHVKLPKCTWNKFAFEWHESRVLPTGFLWPHKRRGLLIQDGQAGHLRLEGRA